MQSVLIQQVREAKVLLVFESTNQIRKVGDHEHTKYDSLHLSQHANKKSFLFKYMPTIVLKATNRLVGTY